MNRRRGIRALVGTASIALTACADQAAEKDAPSPAISDRPAPTAAAVPAEGPSRASRYTALTGCELVREERAEMPYTETLCAGPAGWAVRIADADARQTLGLRGPSEAETRIDLSAVSGGAFNSFGGTAEWRGSSAKPFRPDALIVRFLVAEDPHPAPEVAYLVVLRLTDKPCLIAKIAPGADQNRRARATADGSRACATQTAI